MEQSTIEESNFQLFREILSNPIIEKCTNASSSKKTKARKAKAGRKTTIKPVAKAISIEDESKSDAEELGDFIDYLATEIFTSLPPPLRSMTYSIWLNTPTLQITYSSPFTPNSPIFNILPLSIHETLQTYSLLSENQTVSEFLTPVLNSYLTTLTTAPPPPSQTKDAAEGCEICERDWIPLTYHHLIPRETHPRVLKRGWHTEDQLNNVAWLCRACHSLVHRIAPNEELAKNLFTVNRLLEREDVQAFAKWVGGVRWKSRQRDSSGYEIDHSDQDKNSLARKLKVLKYAAKPYESPSQWDSLRGPIIFKFPTRQLVHTQRAQPQFAP